MSKDPYTVKAHLKATHSALSKFHTAMSAHHEKISLHHSYLAKLDDGEVATHHEHISKAHAAAAGAHANFASEMDDSVELCDSVVKASAMNSDAIVPDRVSGVVRDYPGVTAVARAGQRQIEKSMVDPRIDFVIQEIED
jgi:hypothetical protein